MNKAVTFFEKKNCTERQRTYNPDKKSSCFFVSTDFVGESFHNFVARKQRSYLYLRFYVSTVKNISEKFAKSRLHQNARTRKLLHRRCSIILDQICCWWETLQCLNDSIKTDIWYFRIPCVVNATKLDQSWSELQSAGSRTCPIIPLAFCLPSTKGGVCKCWQRYEYKISEKGVEQLLWSLKTFGVFPSKMASAVLLLCRWRKTLGKMRF